MLTQDNKQKMKVSKRIQMSNKCDIGTRTLLEARTISKNLKIKMYNTLIRPVFKKKIGLSESGVINMDSHLRKCISLCVPHALLGLNFF